MDYVMTHPGGVISGVRIPDFSIINFGKESMWICLYQKCTIYHWSSMSGITPVVTVDEAYEINGGSWSGYAQGNFIAYDTVLKGLSRIDITLFS